MKNILLTAIALIIWITGFSQKKWSETYQTSKGKLDVHLVGHGSLYFVFNNLVIYVDPFSAQADYSTLPKANLIFITHSHGDHWDTAAIRKIQTTSTSIYYTDACDKANTVKGKVLKNGDNIDVNSIKVEVVPAYNIKNMRENGVPFHPKGEGNGYVFNFANKRVYVAGDTEDIPEMKNLKNIDIAFLPMNLPYTMTPEMCANAAKMFMPKILIPYHYGTTDLTLIENLLKSEKNITLILEK